MKKILIVVALVFTAGFLNAAPGRGGYMGHRFIIGIQGAYAPYTFSTFKNFLTRYDIVYGGNFGIIVGRRTQLNLTYDRWSAGGNDLFAPSRFVKEDRLKGQLFGASIRQFRKKKGGIAPVGKFYELGLNYGTAKFMPSNKNQSVIDGNAEEVTFDASFVSAHVSFGIQDVFYDRIVANTGLSIGYPLILNTDNPNYNSNFLRSRVGNVLGYSVFFGVGILL